MAESSKNNLAKTVKRLRGKMGISQEKLARLADVSNNTIINIEAGKQGNPTIETLQKIFNFSCLFLLFSCKIIHMREYSINPMETKQNKPSIPDFEIEWKAVRASGPGGQAVQKQATKVEVRWNIDESGAFTDEQKTLIKGALASRINKEGEIIVASQQERSQKRNHDVAVARLRDLVSAALEVPEERVETKKTTGVRKRERAEKELLKKKKETRRWKYESE